MNDVVREHPPDTQIHVILDNLNTHKPKRDLWLARHRNVHFHYTPTRASWLNQIEIWFSILSRAPPFSTASSCVRRYASLGLRTLRAA